MKLICTEFDKEGRSAFSILGDNALLRNNDDFYFPAFAGNISCIPQIVLRICKLGRSISPRFAHRYYDAIGVGIRFYVDDRLERLRAESLPIDTAVAFDHAAAISPLIPVSETNGEVASTPVNETNEGDTLMLVNETNEGVTLTPVNESNREITFTFHVNGEEQFSGTIADLPCSIESQLAEASRFFLLKIGDYLYCGNPFRYEGVTIGDRLQVTLNSKPLLDFLIK